MPPDPTYPDVLLQRLPVRPRGDSGTEHEQDLVHSVRVTLHQARRIQKAGLRGLQYLT